MSKQTGQLAAKGRLIDYTLNQRRGIRSLRLTVRADRRVMVSAPLRASKMMIDRFIAEKAAWITQALDHFAKRPVTLLSRGTRADYLRHKEAARRLAEERLCHFNHIYGLAYKRVTIRDQKTRWGSCSPSGSLSFNYRIVLLPPRLADYLVVHELCHLRHMNHSKKFWDLVARTIPDYAACRKQLRQLV